jgi:hypothetical protein
MATSYKEESKSFKVLTNPSKMSACTRIVLKHNRLDNAAENVSTHIDDFAAA